MKNIPLINLIETFVCSFGSMNHSICSNLCFDIFWGTGNADFSLFFYLGWFFYLIFQRLAILILNIISSIRNKSWNIRFFLTVKIDAYIFRFCHLLYYFSNELHLFEWINFSTIIMFKWNQQQHRILK